MPDRPCPSCSSGGPRHLQESSSGAICDYYRCDACGHVWAVFRDGSEHIRHVTPLKSESEGDDESLPTG